MLNHKNFFSPLFFIFFLLSLTCKGLSNNHALVKDSLLQESLFESLLQEKPLKLLIQTDLQQLLINKKTDKPQAANLSYQQEGQRYSWSVQIKARGKFRRMNCEFPPLGLEFSKKELASAGFKRLDEIRLVTHCYNDEDTSKVLVLREYLAYKIYNELTSTSYRVQWAQITYEDSRNKKNKFTRWGFLLESTDELAARLQAEETEPYTLLPSQIDTMQERLFTAFQYMIGNTDWSLVPIRNLKVFQREGSLTLDLVPYDFDFSGLVSAPYALPRSDVGQRTVRERIFLGLSNADKDLAATFALLLEKKADIFKIINQCAPLNPSAKEDMVNYINDFYYDIKRKKSFLIIRSF